MADIVKEEDVTFRATYPSEVYPVVQKLANVIMSILPRVADHLGGSEGQSNCQFPGIDTYQCYGGKEYHIRDWWTWPVQPPIEEKWKSNGAGYNKAVRIARARARRNVPDGCASQTSCERTDNPCHETECSITTEPRKCELTHEATGEIEDVKLSRTMRKTK